MSPGRRRRTTRPGMTEGRWRRANVVVGALLLTLILIASARLPIDYDEAYYFTWSRSLAFRYFDHPPLVAWVLAASTELFGVGHFGLRLPALLSTAILFVASVDAARRLLPTAPGLAAELTIWGLAGAAMITVGYLPTTPDPLQGALLGIGAWALVRGERPFYLGLAAFLLTAGVLAKHSTALLFVGAMLGLLRSVEGRRWLLRPAWWLGLGLGLLCLAPWLYTEWNVGGATQFQAARVFGAAGHRWLTALPLWVGAMALTFGPGVAGAQLLQLAAGLRQPPGAPISALSHGAALHLLACLVAAGLGAGELNWLLPALVFGLPAVVVWVAGGPPRRLRWFRVFSLAAAGFGGLVLLHVIAPFLPIEPGKDRTLRAAGFDQVASKAAQLSDALGAKVWITRRYQAASMLRYHDRDRHLVLERSSGRRSQYDLWPRPSLCAGDTAILVLNHEGLSEETRGHVEALAPGLPIERQRAGRVIDRWWITPVRAVDQHFCGGPS